MVSISDDGTFTPCEDKGMQVCLFFSGFTQNFSASTFPNVDTGSLGYFLHTARSLSVPIVRGGSGVPIPDQLAQFGMTAKKSHEVSSFSQYVAHLTSDKDINQVKSRASQH